MIKKIGILIGTIMLVGCSLFPTSSSVIFSSINSNISVSNSFGNNENQKYVSAKRIYDFQYDPQGYDQEILTLSEFPNLVFRISYDQISFSIDGREDLGRPRSIYIADFNNDGYVDLGYSFDLYNSASVKPSRVRIYDYHNDKLIYDFDNQQSSYLNIDENGNAIMEEIAETKPWGLSKVKRIGRFLRGEEISFEWDSFDGVKLKSISLLNTSEYGYKDGMIYAYANKEISLKLSLCGIVSKTLEESFVSVDQVKVKRNDEFYSFEVENISQTKHPLIYINFVFLKTGTIDVEISIDQAITRETIFVDSD